jgi:hypothetical protein
VLCCFSQGNRNICLKLLCFLGSASILESFQLPVTIFSVCGNGGLIPTKNLNFALNRLQFSGQRFLPTRLIGPRQSKTEMKSDQLTADRTKIRVLVAGSTGSSGFPVLLLLAISWVSKHRDKSLSFPLTFPDPHLIKSHFPACRIYWTGCHQRARAARVRRRRPLPRPLWRRRGAGRSCTPILAVTVLKYPANAIF